MNESAILHIPDSQYCFAVGEKKLVIRLRMAKEDADASVTLIYAGKYQFQQSREQIPMEIRYTDRLYHYYETTLVLTDVRLAYVFCIRQQGTTYYFCEDGVVLQYDFAEGFYNFFQMPYINRNDVLPTVKWMKSAVFYQIFPERFCNGNPKLSPENVAPWGTAPDKKGPLLYQYGVGGAADTEKFCGWRSLRNYRKTGLSEGAWNYGHLSDANLPVDIESQV